MTSRKLFRIRNASMAVGIQPLQRLRRAISTLTLAWFRDLWSLSQPIPGEVNMKQTSTRSPCAALCFLALPQATVVNFWLRNCFLVFVLMLSWCSPGFRSASGTSTRISTVMWADGLKSSDMHASGKSCLVKQDIQLFSS